MVIDNRHVNFIKINLAIIKLTKWWLEDMSYISFNTHSTLY